MNNMIEKPCIDCGVPVKCEKSRKGAIRCEADRKKHNREIKRKHYWAHREAYVDKGKRVAAKKKKRIREEKRKLSEVISMKIRSAHYLQHLTPPKFAAEVNSILSGEHQYVGRTR